MTFTCISDNCGAAPSTPNPSICLHSLRLIYQGSRTCSRYALPLCCNTIGMPVAQFVDTVPPTVAECLSMSSGFARWCGYDWGVPPAVPGSSSSVPDSHTIDQSARTSLCKAMIVIRIRVSYPSTSHGLIEKTPNLFRPESPMPIFEANKSLELNTSMPVSYGA